MRLLLELIIVAAIIAIAWEKSFKDRVNDIPVFGDKLTEITDTKKHPRSSARHPHPTATVSGAWMWDPNRKSALDRPSPTAPPLRDNP